MRQHDIENAHALPTAFHVDLAIAAAFHSLSQFIIICSHERLHQWYPEAPFDSTKIRTALVQD
jgi:hypothetical protein